MARNLDPKLKERDKFTMKKISFIKTLAEASGQETYMVKLKSPRTGNEYTTEAFDAELVALGQPEKIEKVKEDGTKITVYNYEIFDALHDLGYRIQAPAKVPTKSYTKLIFKQVTGGSTGNGYWMKAKSVEVPEKDVK